LNVLTATLVVLASLAADKAAPGKFAPIDLKAVVNTDPLGVASPFATGIAFQLPEWQWMEGEAVYKKNSGVEIESHTRSSAGNALGGTWGAKAGDWAEWNFDLPWGSDDMQLYLRLARKTGNQMAKLNVTWDGETAWNAFVPLTGGGGDSDRDYETGLVRLELKRQQMGRHILRIATEGEGDAISLDGFWLCNGQLDIVNRVGPDGRIKPPANVHNLVFPPGQRTVRGIDVVLINPDENAQKAYFLSSDSPLILVTGDVNASACHLLGGGIRIQANQRMDPTPSTAKATIAYVDGPEERVDVTFDPIYARGEVQGATVTLGMGRVGYMIKIPLDAVRKVHEIRIQPGEGRFAVIAATLELTTGN
jgi:hypothetical protein